MRIGLLLVLTILISVCQGFQLDAQHTDCRDSGELKFPVREVEPSCLYDADNGGCEFYKCFERRFPCDACGFAQGYGNNVCERFHNPSYLSRFDHQGKLWVNSTNRCILASLKEKYQRSAISCDTTTTTLVDRISVCYLRNDVDISICDIAEVNKNALLGVFAAGEFVNSHRIFTEIVQLITNCAGSKSNSPMKLQKPKEETFITSGPTTEKTSNKFLFKAGGFEGPQKVEKIETETRPNDQIFSNSDFGINTPETKLKGKFGSSARIIGERINNVLNERRNRITKRIKDIKSRFNQTMRNRNLPNIIRNNSPVRNFISNTRRRIGTRAKAIGERIKGFVPQNGNKSIEQRLQSIMSRIRLPKLNELVKKIDADVRNRKFVSKTRKRIEMFAKNISDRFRNLLSNDKAGRVLEMIEPFIPKFNKSQVSNDRFTDVTRFGGHIGNSFSNDTEGIKTLATKINDRVGNFVSINGKPIRERIQQIIQRINKSRAKGANKTEFGGRIQDFVANVRNKINDFVEDNEESLRDFVSEGRKRLRELVKQMIGQNATNDRFVNDTVIIGHISKFMSNATNAVRLPTEKLNERMGDKIPGGEELTGERLTQQTVQSTTDGDSLGNTEFGGRIRNLVKKTKDRITKSSKNIRNRLKHMVLDGGKRIRDRVQHFQNRTRNGQLVNNTDFGGRIQDFFSNTRNILNKYAKQIRNRINSNLVSEVGKRKIDIIPIVNPHSNQTNSVSGV